MFNTKMIKGQGMSYRERRGSAVCVPWA